MSIKWPYVSLKLDRNKAMHHLWADPMVYILCPVLPETVSK